MQISYVLRKYQLKSFLEEICCDIYLYSSVMHKLVKKESGGIFSCQNLYTAKKEHNFFMAAVHRCQFQQQQSTTYNPHRLLHV